MTILNMIRKPLSRKKVINGSVACLSLALFAIIQSFCEMGSQAAEGVVPAPSITASDQITSPTADQRSAIEQGLRHIYAVYLGIRSCSEISTMQNDRSFMPEVSLDDARTSLRQVDAAAKEVGVNTSPVWDAEAPIALITAEALKTRPETHLVFCQKMGSLFRTDAGNLQAIFRQLGARTTIITKDY